MAAGHGLRSLRRDLRARDTRILAAALAIAVGALSAVGFFVDRVERGIAERATELLAADLVVESPRPPDDVYVEAARDRDLATSRSVSFPTVLVVGERTELVAAKAVDDAYPLRGAARIAPAPGAATRAADAGPAAGTAWLDPRLFARLDLAAGERIPLGDAELAVAATLTHEPDRAGSLFQLAPRVMFHRDDLAATNLISAQSRATYGLLVAGGPAAISDYRAWLEQRAGPDIEIRGVEDARPEMRTTIDRATVFLGLAAMMSVLLAGAAVAIAVHAFSAREADVSALMRCFGARQARVLRGLLLRLLVIGTGASLLGVGLGWLAQAGLVLAVGDWFGGSLPAAGGGPAIAGVAAGLVTLVGFGLVPALRIRRVPVLRVLRRDQALPEPSALAAALIAIAALSLLLVAQAGDLRLGLYVLAGTLALVGALGLAAWLLVHLGGRLRGSGLSPARFGLAGVVRRSRTSSVQTVGFGLGLLALLLLSVVRVDVLDAWGRQIPADAPTQFMVNIQPDDVDAVRQRLQTAGVDTGRFYPLIRGRLVEIDGSAIGPDDYAAERARRLVDREFNLSRVQRPPSGNAMAAGRWWHGASAVDDPEWSVETGVAERLGIALDDELTFRVGGREVRGRVTSLRKVNWESFQPNFFVVGNPAALAGVAATYMTAYRLPAGGDGDIPAIVRDHAGITVLDVEALLDQVRAVIDQGSRAVEYVFLFTLAAGIVVLVAAVNASREERRAEIALLRTLGASRGRVRRGLIVEFAVIGGLAGGIAALGASVTGWVVSTRILELPYAVDPWLFMAGIGGGGAGIALAGLIATRRLVNEPPVSVLRGQ